MEHKVILLTKGMGRGWLRGDQAPFMYNYKYFYDYALHTAGRVGRNDNKHRTVVLFVAEKTLPLRAVLRSTRICACMQKTRKITIILFVPICRTHTQTYIYKCKKYMVLGG